MKIRTGFVSNSSSSSYFVEIEGIDLKDFLNKLFIEYTWNHFNKSEIEARLYQCIENNKVAKRDYNKSGVSRLFEKNYDTWLKDSENDLDQFKKAKTDEALVKFVIKYNGINLKHSKDKIRLSTWTSMHNSFNEGMPELLKEIVLFFSFDTEYKVNCKRVDES